ncbi:MAG TPA: sugar transferase [Chitinophagaceae bacterium]|jgi:putative colanic acid biosynthesis UDP-glucose lipid carrier transferase|nr:sugar transferase [Chitinophagaceae bacterium]
MSIPAQHTATQNLSVGKWPVRGQNGIVRSFVATRQKYLFVKRGFDLVFSVLVVLLVLTWLVPLTGLIIKMNSAGPVFFRQKRMGKNGRPYCCIKFRTMIRNPEADERPAEENDERITGVGKFLRRMNLDELPQFINVLMGQMSVVGPRPHMMADCIRFSFVVPSYQFRSLVRPGITGWAQINGYHGPTADYESIIVRYYWDAQYVRKANLWLDIKIIWTTVTQTFQNLFAVITGSFRKKKFSNNSSV